MRASVFHCHYPSEVWKIVLLGVMAGVQLGAQIPAPVQDTLNQAYGELRARRYDAAIASFRRAIAAAKVSGAIHKDLAYTYLKTGDTEAARDEFGAAMKLDAGDTQAALEYAFLCYETKQAAEARRTFDRIRKTGNATAEQAFRNIDKPLAEGIERWKQAVQLAPDNFSAHLELAKLAEQRDETSLAAEHYEAAWKLRPQLRELLLDLGRVWQKLDRASEANAALLAASRSEESRVAESALELLPRRYPYVYEFRDALAIDPGNVELHRELAYLLLEMGDKPAAEREFNTIVKQAPDDLLSAAQLGFLRLARKDTAGAMPLLDRVLKGGDDELADRVRSALRLPQTLKRRPDTPPNQVSLEAKVLAERSLKAGYLKDALKYLKVAHEADPLDFSVMLKLGWANNILHNDKEAVRWFNLARKSPDPDIASEAEKAYRNLETGQELVRTTVWAFPFYSSRWQDAFGYGQVKTAFQIGGLPLQPYVSAWFVGDTRQRMPGLDAAYLSESSVILGVGVTTSVWHGLSGWMEGGSVISYQSGRTGGADYRGGAAFARGAGHLLGAESKGLFAETNDDGVFLSRFDNDFILYSQNRTGYTVGSFGAIRAQVFWNWNVTSDAKRQYWANAVETGPGVRFRVDGLPRSLVFSVNYIHGVYMINEGNPWGSVYNDMRVGFWYAFTH